MAKPVEGGIEAEGGVGLVEGAEGKLGSGGGAESGIGLVNGAESADGTVGRFKLLGIHIGSNTY